MQRPQLWLHEAVFLLAIEPDTGRLLTGPDHGLRLAIGAAALQDLLSGGWLMLGASPVAATRAFYGSTAERDALFPIRADAPPPPQTYLGWMFARLVEDRTPRMGSTWLMRLRHQPVQEMAAWRLAQLGVVTLDERRFALHDRPLVDGIRQRLRRALFEEAAPAPADCLLLGLLGAGGLLRDALRPAEPWAAVRDRVRALGSPLWATQQLLFAKERIERARSTTL